MLGKATWNVSLIKLERFIIIVNNVAKQILVQLINIRIITIQIGKRVMSHYVLLSPHETVVHAQHEHMRGRQIGLYQTYKFSHIYKKK